MRIFLPACLSCLVLAACGIKGPLYMAPPKPAPATAPAPATSSAPVDSSKAPQAAPTR